MGRLRWFCAHQRQLSLEHLFSSSEAFMSPQRIVWCVGPNFARISVFNLCVIPSTGHVCINDTESLATRSLWLDGDRKDVIRSIGEDCDVWWCKFSVPKSGHAVFVLVGVVRCRRNTSVRSPCHVAWQGQLDVPPRIDGASVDQPAFALTGVLC